MKMTGGASASRLTKRQQLEEDKACGQILPTVEVIMKNENDRRSLGNNKAHKKAAAGGSKRGQILPTVAAEGRQRVWDRSSHQQRSI